MKKIIGIVIASMMFCSSAFSASSPVRWEKTAQEHDVNYYLKKGYSIKFVNYVKGPEGVEDDSIVYTLIYQTAGIPGRFLVISCHKINWKYETCYKPKDQK